MCAIGYTFSQTALKCVPCNSEKALFSFFNVIALIFVSLLFLLVVHSVYTFRVNKTVCDLEDYQLYLLVKVGVCKLNDFQNSRDNLRLDLVNWRSRLEQIFKNYVILFQVIRYLKMLNT